MSRVLLIDNVDSFTCNIADLLHRVLGRPPVLWRHDHPATERDLAGFAAIVVGPGPGRPQVPADLGVSALALAQRSVPVLGICLGHQGLAHLAGEPVVQMPTPRHGIVSPVHHDGSGIFAGLPSPFEAVRYHSLQVELTPGSTLLPVARAGDDGSLMALRDPSGCRHGLQFHPESVLSQHGDLLVANFLREAGVPLGPPPGGDVQDVALGDVLHPTRVVPRRRRALALRTVRLGGPVDDWAVHERLVADGGPSCWLDASDGSGVSVIALSTGPLAHLLTHRVGEGEPPLLDRLEEHLAAYRMTGDHPLPFDVRPGLFGYLGYEVKAETGGRPAHRAVHPDAQLLFSDRVVVLHHATGDLHALTLVDEATATAQEAWLLRVTELVQALRAGGPVEHRSDPGCPPPAPPQGGLLARHSPQAYQELVGRCLSEIGAGESYEICLTTELTWQGAVDPAALHRTLRRISPAPRGAWLRLPGLDVVSASPERFVSLTPAGVVQARPIKGTRARGADPEQDAALAHDLATRVKDRAENLMIVDLLRHDLHRVCRSGSVQVSSLFAVETYATVHQLVSTVTGQLADGMGPLDVLRATFPGGSMTGAPKVRTMEILDDLEGAPRGVYSGAIGWVGLNGALDTSIVIRTAVVTPQAVTIGVGGAVTALSDPAEEYAEMRTKAAALLAALAEATGRSTDQATG